MIGYCRRGSKKGRILFQGLKDQDLHGGLEARSKRVISWAILMKFGFGVAQSCCKNRVGGGVGRD